MSASTRMLDCVRAGSKLHPHGAREGQEAGGGRRETGGEGRGGEGISASARMQGFFRTDATMSTRTLGASARTGFYRHGW
jgi:hypothetical protein